ncbi:MAG: aldose 1-epimerase [Actinobacteria bacterium]|nr:aldose 1-epimerase [Actinomycetota bacterium]
MAPYSIDQQPHPDFPNLTVVSMSSPDDLIVNFIPGAGMVGSSIRHRGEEILGMRGGLASYLESGKTFGIPLLAPWANRLSANEFDGKTLVVDGTPGVHLDENGLAIHGLLSGCPDWRITRMEAVADGPEVGAHLSAELDFTADRPEFPGFPFPHLLAVTVHVHEAKVSITTAVTATTDQRVPVAFGWHPYFAPPGGDRQDWTLAKPFTHHVELDDQTVPTGEVTRVPVEVDVLGDPQAGGLTFDDLYCEVPEATEAFIEGGGRRITVSYDQGYPYGVLFAPGDQDLVAIEPMSAPTDPLAGHFPIRVAEPGETFAARYSINITDSSVRP